MVPDGGQACADIRWCCKDTRSCTQRWTARLPGTGRAASIPSAGEPGPGDALDRQAVSRINAPPPRLIIHLDNIT
jgi:hypothetical protein